MNDDYTVALLEAIAEKLGIDVAPLKAAAARAQEDRLFTMVTASRGLRDPQKTAAEFRASGWSLPYTGGPLYEAPRTLPAAPVDPDRPVAR